MAEEKKKQYELVEVPTQHQLAVQTPEGETISVEQLMVHIANEIIEVKKVVG